jgi:hypothetical protein
MERFEQPNRDHVKILLRGLFVGEVIIFGLAFLFGYSSLHQLKWNLIVAAGLGAVPAAGMSMVLALNALIVWISWIRKKMKAPLQNGSVMTPPGGGGDRSAN